jgi:hypothetical protein
VRFAPRETGHRGQGHGCAEAEPVLFWFWAHYLSCGVWHDSGTSSRLHYDVL